MTQGADNFGTQPPTNGTPAVPVDPPRKPTPPAPPAQSDGGGSSDASLSQIIDTIEAIIIALIVALTFRAFIVEAFVIPTGSMAPTLLGAHYKVICPECGCAFDFEASLDFQYALSNVGPIIPGTPERRPELHTNWGVPLPLDGRTGETASIVCPNCRYTVRPEQLPQYLRDESKIMPDGRQPRSGAKARVDFAWANNGDRILVLKYLYSVMEPNRWDVIVFKEPQRTQDNYIKRLVGLPGDSLQILSGDVYISRGDNLNDLSQYQIARKPESLQTALWQLVYDNDCYPIDAGKPRAPANDPNDPFHAPFVSPWQGDANWTQGPVMTYAGAGTSGLSFNLTPPQARESPYTLNTLGFNNDYYRPESTSPRAYVGDLRMEALWEPVDAAGASVDLTLGRPANCYRVSWSATGARLLRYNPTANAFAPVDGVTASITPQPGKAYRLALNNVDRAVRFYIDGTLVLSYEQPWTAQQARDEESTFPSLFEGNLGLATGGPNTLIRIDVGGRCTLAHLKLFRDLYYTQVYGVGGGYPPTGTEGHPIKLGPDDYFALGDNSRRSSDSRFWNTTFDAAGDLGLRNGLVPRRYLLGKAFFVYWPAGYRATESFAPVKNWPLVPNTGDMRVIR